MATHSLATISLLLITVLVQCQASPAYAAKKESWDTTMKFQPTAPADLTSAQPEYTTSPPQPIETYTYVAACTPAYSSTSSALDSCSLTFTCDVATSITISSATEYYELDLVPYMSYRQTLSASYRVTEGLQDKGIRIQSKHKLFIAITKGDELTQMTFIDSTSLAERQDAGDDYFVIQPHEVGLSACSSPTYNFYTIVSFDEVTDLEITYPNGLIDRHIRMQTYNTYTKRYTTENADDTGHRIRSSGPVTVFSGVACFIRGSVQGSYISTLAPLKYYGQQFNAPFMGTPVDGTYKIRVLASQNATNVSGNGITSRVIHAGNVTDLEYSSTRDFQLITCSKKCAAMYIQHGIRNEVGYFMMPLTATEHFYKSTYFSTIDFTLHHNVTIVVQGHGPMGDVYMDGKSLEDEFWASRGAYSVVVLPLNNGFHRIYSSSLRLLCAYVYSNTGDDGGAYGFPALSMDG